MLFVIETVTPCHPQALKGCFYAYIGYTGYNAKKLKNAKNAESLMDAGSVGEEYFQHAFSLSYLLKIDS